ncbi:hypothetical protein [Bacillus mesophilum]|nr:hypothetical protein [Bacillus mesophilum]
MTLREFQQKFSRIKNKKAQNYICAWQINYSLFEKNSFRRYQSI